MIEYTGHLTERLLCSSTTSIFLRIFWAQTLCDEDADTTRKGLANASGLEVKQRPRVLVYCLCVDLTSAFPTASACVMPVEQQELDRE